MIRSLNVEVTMNNQNQNNFMDSRTLMAVVLVAVLFVGWQSYLKNKYGNQPAQNQATTTQTTVAPTGGTSGEAAPPAQTTPPNPVAAESISAVEKVVKYENSNISFEVSSKGMGLKNLVLKNHTDRAHQPMKLGESDVHTLFELGLLNRSEALNFDVTQKSENEFEGVAQFGNTQIRRNLKINPETEAIENTVVVSNTDANFPGLAILIPEKAMKTEGGGSFIGPSLEHQEFVVLHSGTTDRVNSSSAKEKVNNNYSAVSLVGIGSQYFTSALVDKSELIPDAVVSGGKDAKEILAQAQYKPAPGKNSMELKWISYSGGKSYAVLEKIDKDLAKVVDFGFFSAIARVLLMTLRWLDSNVGNWGISIILLTLFVRILVLPLNITTFRSTKKMQKLQPVMASLRERYKDDPQALNREMMNVWKEHKVNPMGGCLPMLLQLPIFFALYRVLGQSIELYQAPFFGWIQDLSLKDPFYVLPVLMAICMYIQQKMTPTTMDPTQAKVMQFLPLVFAFMMVSLPSGLTLYIFINTLSGIILQRMFMRDRSTAIPAKKEVKA